MKHFVLTCLVPFGTPALADINPTDGPWFGKVRGFSSTGCPAQMVQQMQAAGPQDATFDLVWDGTEPSFGDFQWVRTDENQFQAVINEGQDTQMGSIKIQSILNLTVLSETAMAQTGRTTIALNGQLADQFGSMNNCAVTHSVDYSYQG